MATTVEKKIDLGTGKLNLDPGLFNKKQSHSDALIAAINKATDEVRAETAMALHSSMVEELQQAADERIAHSGLVIGMLPPRARALVDSLVNEVIETAEFTDLPSEDEIKNEAKRVHGREQITGKQPATAWANKPLIEDLIGKTFAAYRQYFVAMQRKASAEKRKDKRAAAYFQVKAGEALKRAKGEYIAMTKADVPATLARMRFIAAMNVVERYAASMFVMDDAVASAVAEAAPAQSARAKVRRGRQAERMAKGKKAGLFSTLGAILDAAAKTAFEIEELSDDEAFASVDIKSEDDLDETFADVEVKSEADA